MGAADSQYETIRIVAGHTRVGGGARVQLGASSKVTVDQFLDAVPAKAVLGWLHRNRDFFTEPQFRRITADIAENCVARAMLGALGDVFSDDHDRYRTVQETDVRAETAQQNRFLRSLHTLRNRPLRISCEIELYGTSMLPTDAGVFARVTQVRFADGLGLTFVDLAGLVAAGLAGETGAVRATRSQRLKIVPLD
jgi:hypothetical protein